MNKLFAQITAPVSRPVAARALTRVFVRDLVLNAMIGVYEQEKLTPQRIRINIDLMAALRPGPSSDDLADVVSYETVVNNIRAVVESGHVNLVETLAERIAERCLIDRRVQSARVRVEKLDVWQDVGSVGVEIEREQE
jgi:dihydroneopterin aldolase